MITTFTTFTTTPTSTVASTDGPARDTTQRRVAWLPWVTAGRPATTFDEVRFLERLQLLANDTVTDHRRADVTAVLNALRSGITLDELLDRAPGLQPTRLLSAYLTVERERSGAAQAWHGIVDRPDAQAFRLNRSRAERLLPVPIDRLRVAIEVDPANFADAVHRCAVEIDTASEIIRRVESELDECTDPARARSLGLSLYDAQSQSGFVHEHFLPWRVGALAPSRLAALLGERSVSTDGIAS